MVRYLSSGKQTHANDNKNMKYPGLLHQDNVFLAEATITLILECIGSDSCESSVQEPMLA